MIKRYKRFFVDVRGADGEIITVHNANTGSMKSLLAEGNPVLYSESADPKRKLPYSLELINVGGEWIVSNTIVVNRIVEAALIDGELPQLYSGKGRLRREFPYKDSRIDFLIEEDERPCLVEVKSVTYFDDKASYFPDAVTSRGKKHLLTLMDAVKEGYRAVMLYVCMADRPAFGCAKDIDPAYCAAMEDAAKGGVELIAVHALYNKAENKLRLTNFA